MNSKQLYIAFIFSGLILGIVVNQTNAQTVIKSGEISGVWTKKMSPYIIKGDVNVPAGKKLYIQPGVQVKFSGLFTLNVQGSLLAIGNEKDSIIFTVFDTTGIKERNRYGWCGIHFDRRPVTWDTLRFKMPEREEIRNIVNERIKNGRLDTATKIRLVMTIPDAVNDTVLVDSVFFAKEASKLSYCRFEYATSEGKKQPYVFGGAIYIYRYSNLVINNCLFENNFAYAGGAIYCKEAAPVIKGNTIRGCRAQSSGGAMVFIHSGPLLINNTVTGNFSGYNGGAILFYESSPYVLNNTFLRNMSESSGGAVFCEQQYDSLLWLGMYSPSKEARFTRDASFEKENLNPQALKGVNSYFGRFINNIICDNKAVRGGGIGLYGTAPEFTNVTLSNNIADTAGGGIYCNLSSPKVTNSIIYGNSHDQVFLIGESRPVFSYCDIESGIAGIEKDSTCKGIFEFDDIISVPPKFVSPAIGDYSLQKESGCIDAGLADTSSLQLTALDLSGGNRIVNGIIDLGALEYKGEKSKLKSTKDIEECIEEFSDTQEEMLTSIFPNPNEGRFSVVIHNNIYESLTIKIFSQNGQNIYTDNFKAGKWFEQQIDINKYAHGIFIVMIYSDDVLIYNGEIIVE